MDGQAKMSNARINASLKSRRVKPGGLRGGRIKDSRGVFRSFRSSDPAGDRADMPQAGILGGGTQLGNNRCQ